MIYEVSPKARNSTALPTVIMATLPWRLMMSPDIRYSGNGGNVRLLYHFCAPTRRIAQVSLSDEKEKNCLERGLCGAGPSTKLLLTRGVGPLIVARSRCSFPIATFAVRDWGPIHEPPGGFSSHSISNHDGPHHSIPLPCEASAPDPCVVLSHWLDSAQSVLECRETSR
jgi:hypothetical protein